MNSAQLSTHLPHPFIETPVKASFAGCPLSDRALFKSSRCILPISIMGRKEHEGKRFRATMQLVNTSFRSCTLLIVDSLYRHTLKIDFPNKTSSLLGQEAKAAGKAWVNRNREACQLLTIPNQIIYWDDCLNHLDFIRQFEIVSNLYQNDRLFQETLDLTAKDYLARCLLNDTHQNIDESEAFQCCVDYLKEECAGMCLWVDGQYDFEVYPTGRSPILAMTYERLIQPYYPALLKPVSLRFKK